MTAARFVLASFLASVLAGAIALAISIANAAPGDASRSTAVAGDLGPGTIRLTPVASGLQNPVDIVFAPGDPTRMFIVEQGGRVRIVRDGVVLPVPFLDASAKTQHEGERGLLAMAFDPGYAQNRRFFVFYTRRGDGAVVIERYERNIDEVERADPDSGRTLFAIPHPGASNHNGGKLAFGADGYLYIATGDGGGSNDPFQNGQNVGTRLGKILRVDANVNATPWYAIPASNPHAAQSCNGSGQGICPELWALGLRNPWRISFDKLNGDLFIGDVGQGDREEIDRLPFNHPGGANFGWRILEGMICTPAFGSPCAPPANYVPPIVDYPRSLGVSVTGGFRYRGSAIPPLAGAYLYGDFGSRRVWAATQAGAGAWTGNQQLLTAGEGIASFGEDHDGELYIAGYSGTIFRIDPADQDADGLPDWWEQLHFGSPTAAAASVDSDGDGASNLAEFLGNTDPHDPLSEPTGNPGQAPAITSVASLVCIVDAPCTLGVVATGRPTPTLSRSGTLPAGLGYNSSTRVVSGTPAASAVGTHVQTFTASNGFGPDAVQQLRIVVVAGCGGFSDVTAAEAYCNPVEWLRNRAIAQGCTSTQYCPASDVLRASMALFMHRLGDAMTPTLGAVEGSTGTVDAAAGAMICTMADLPPAAFPRDVEIRYAVSLQHADAATVATTLMASRNGGATWDAVSATRVRTQTTGPAWRSAQGVAVASIEAGQTTRFALRLDRESATGSVAATRCQVTALAASRDGAAAPRDALPLAP